METSLNVEPPLNVNEEDLMIKALSRIPDSTLGEMVKTARALRAKTAKDSIPQKVKDSLVLKHDRMVQGQTISMIVRPEILFTFTVKGQRDYEDIEIKAELVNDDDRGAKAFFDAFDIATNWFDEPLYTFAKIEPRLYDVQQQERKIMEAWDVDYHHLSSEYGVDAWALVEELKKDVTKALPEVSED